MNPGGDGTLAGTCRRSLAGDAGRDGKKSLADDPAGPARRPGGARSTLPLAKRAQGERRRTTTLAGTARMTLAGPADDPDVHGGRQTPDPTV